MKKHLIAFHSTTCNDNRSELQDLIEKRRWRTIQRRISKRSVIAQLQNIPLALHLAIQHHAPISIIQAIHLHNPDCISEKDSRGRNAIHIAAAAWAEPETISFLLGTNPKLVFDTDREGRCPLHLLLVPAAEIGAKTWRSNSSYRSVSPSCIQSLLVAGPSAVNKEDDHEMTPLEYGLLHNDLPLEVVKLMRDASVEHWKKEERTKKSQHTCVATNASDNTRNTCTHLDIHVSEADLSFADESTRQERTSAASTGEASTTCVRNLFREASRKAKRRISINAITA